MEIPANKSYALESEEPRDSGKAVKAGIEGQNALNAVALHHGEVHRIASGKMSTSKNNFFRTLNMAAFHSQHLIRHAQQSVECGLNRIVAVDRGIAVENFLQYFGVSHQTLALAHQFFKPSLRVAPVGMGGADEIHRNIGIDKNHGCGPVP